MKSVEVSKNVTLENCFAASQLITWLVDNNITMDRSGGIEVGQQFVEILVIKPGIF